jgi:hypothetical protein
MDYVAEQLDLGPIVIPLQSKPALLTAGAMLAHTVKMPKYQFVKAIVL